MNRRWIGATLLSSVGLLGLGAGALLWMVSRDAPLPSGAQLAGYSLAGVRPSKLPQHLENLRSILAEQPVIVEQAPAHRTKLKEWGVELDVAATHQAILDAWARVPLWERIFSKPRLLIQPQWATIPELFQAQMDKFRFLERAPQDARVRFRNGQIETLPGQDGWTPDQEASYHNLIDALRYLPAARTVFPLAMRTTPPRITTEQTGAITGVVASYTTRFPGYQVQRNHNIRLAAQALDGRVLLPGERLSYNQAVGKRTLKQGFRPAPVIIYGEKRLGIGGGICQVSSTLFNAALLGDLKIVRRANHSIPVDYVPLGRDATVTDTGIDFVIENSFDHPIALSTELGRSSLTIRVLGAPQPQRRVVLKTERTALPTPSVQRVPDPTLPEGKERVVKKGSAGVRVILWREVYENGVLVKRERVATSTYRAQPRVIAVGSKPKATPHGILSPKGDDTDA
ncbi:MAG: VanW family protein [Fimbriimonadales bacterium]|nr:VanW family protein [Fimbriimonadales bacterium]